MTFWKKPQKGWLVMQPTSQGWRWCCKLPGKQRHQGIGMFGLPNAADVETLLLLPGEQVTLACVTLANATPQALRWQLEPLLTDDLEQLHIVDLERQGDTHLMGAIAADALREALQALAESGYHAQRVLPDTLALKPGARLLVDDRWLIRLADGSALVLPEAALPHFPALAELDEVSGDALLLLAQGARSCRYSLLQGAFAVQRSRRKPLIALSIALMLCWISVLFPPLWQGWQAQRGIEHLNQQLLARYQHFFPQETPEQPRRAFSRKAELPEQADPRSGLLSLLRDSSALLEKLDENPVQTLNWDDATQQLRLRFRDTLPAAKTLGAPAEVQAQVKDAQLTLSRKS